MFLRSCYHDLMARDSSAEKIARLVAALESGDAWDVKREGPLQVLNVGNIIDATDFAISNWKSITRPLTDLEDIRLPFETTLIAVDMPFVIHSGEINSEEHVRDWQHFSQGGNDLTYLGVLYPHTTRPNVITCSNVVGFHRPSEDGQPRGDYMVIGPTALFSIEVNEDGSPGENFWEDFPEEARDPSASSEEINKATDIEAMMFRTALEVVNMANCANIEIVEPRRTRAERRRMARISPSAVVTQLMIRTKGTRARSSSVVQQSDNLTPLHHVRGHVAHYGDCCPGRHAPRGLLFGKITAKVWVPSHARGDERNGTREHAYTVEP